jgi:A/G-specific adenine glycosylase
MHNDIIDWYKLNKRNLAFREYSDPYAIWVSEIMAQQTQIITMLPYFEKWMSSFPTIQMCADADIDDILKLWQGLGYYRRARNLHEGCQFIVKQFNGVFPDNYIDIRKVPGIGDYTASAILSIAFNKMYPAVDGNVLRVVSRITESFDDVSLNRTKSKIHSIVAEWMMECSNCDYSSFTQGLMEVGATICTPKAPKCENCPLKMRCKSYYNNTVSSIPYKSPKKSIPTHSIFTYIIIHNNKILVSEDWSDGLMIGYYRLPNFNASNQGLITNKKYLGRAKHTFSHKKWDLTIYEADLSNPNKTPSHTKWIELSRVHNLPWSTAYLKIIAKYLKG